MNKEKARNVLEGFRACWKQVTKGPVSPEFDTVYEAFLSSLTEETESSMKPHPENWGSKWIDVNERLPEVFGYYLITYETDKTKFRKYLGALFKEKKIRDSNGNLVVRKEFVYPFTDYPLNASHWMPIPDPGLIWREHQKNKSKT